MNFAVRTTRPKAVLGERAETPTVLAEVGVFVYVSPVYCIHSFSPFFSVLPPEVCPYNAFEGNEKGGGGEKERMGRNGCPKDTSRQVRPRQEAKTSKLKRTPTKMSSFQKASRATRVDMPNTADAVWLVQVLRKRR